MLLGIILLALSAAGSPVVQIREPNLSLPFSLRLNVSGSTLPDIDRARAARLKANAGSLSRRQSSFDVTNEAVIYIASGEPYSCLRIACLKGCLLRT